MKIIKFEDSVGPVYVNLEKTIIEVRPQRVKPPLVIIKQGAGDYPDVYVDTNVSRDDIYKAERINEIIKSFIASTSNFVDIDEVDSDLEYTLSTDPEYTLNIY